MNSSTDGGIFSPLALLSLYTNQLPGGLKLSPLLEMLVPSQIKVPVGTTASTNASSPAAVSPAPSPVLAAVSAQG